MEEKSYEQKLRILHQNVFMGLDATSFPKGVRNMLRFYTHSSAEKINQAADVREHVRTVLAKKPDILGLTEVFGETQLEQVCNMLRDEKIDYIHYSPAFELPLQSEFLYNIIASKKPLQLRPDPDRKLYSIMLPQWLSLLLSPEKNRLANAFFNFIDRRWGKKVPGYFRSLQDGVITSVDIPDYKLDLHYTHLPLPSKKKVEGVSEAVSGVIEQTDADKPTIFFGDMNVEYDQLAKYAPELPEKYHPLTSAEATCSMVPILRMFRKKIDHILGTGSVESLASGVIKGKSDHLGVWADVKVKDE